jgi:hypothetical protein
MKRSSRPTKTPANLSETVHQRLNMYALAAGASGVGLLALAPRADAKIIYTPAHAKVNRLLPIDLNHDGVVDFYLNIGGHSSVSRTVPGSTEERVLRIATSVSSSRSKDGFISVGRA